MDCVTFISQKDKTCNDIKEIQMKEIKKEIDQRLGDDNFIPTAPGSIMSFPVATLNSSTLTLDCKINKVNSILQTTSVQK